MKISEYIVSTRLSRPCEAHTEVQAVFTIDHATKYLDAGELGRRRSPYELRFLEVRIHAGLERVIAKMKNKSETNESS